jgi:hypothetical protein
MRNFTLIIAAIAVFTVSRSNGQTGIPISTEFHGVNAWLIRPTQTVVPQFAPDFTPHIGDIVGSGARYVRIGGIATNWEQLYNFHPTTFTITDATRLIYLIDKIRAAGMEPIIQVSFAPPTLTACPVYTPQSLYNALGNLTVDEQAEVAANLVYFLNDPSQGHYKFKPVMFWSIANEPDHAHLDANNPDCANPSGYSYSSVANATDISNYVLKFAARMKFRDAGIRIIAPELAAFGNDANYSVNKIMNALVTNSSAIMAYTSVPNGTNTVSVPLVDLVSFHYYANNASSAPDIIADPTKTNDGFAKKLNSTGISGKRGLMEMVQSVSRPNDPLQVACTEYNIDLHHTDNEGTAAGYTAMINGHDNRSFLGGQWLAEVNAEAMGAKNGGIPLVRFMNLWSVKEGGRYYNENNEGDNPLGYISNCPNTEGISGNANVKRPMFWHYWMLANNFTGTFYPTSYNDKRTENVKAFAAASGDRMAVMILNQTANQYSFSVNLQNTSAPTPTNGFASIGFNIPAATGTTVYTAAGANATTALLDAHTTVLLLYNCKGQAAERYDYRRSGVITPSASATYTPEHTTLGAPLIGATLTLTTVSFNAVNHTATVSMAPGNYTYTWAGPICNSVVAASPAGVNATLVACDGENDVTYTYTAVDPNGCKSSQLVTVTSPGITTGTVPYIYFNGCSKSDCTIANGTASVSMGNCGGNSQVKWDNGAWGSNTYTSGLAPGPHTVQVQCSTVSETYTFFVPFTYSSLPVARAGADRLAIKNTSVTLFAYPDMSSWGYTYAWYKGSSTAPSATTPLWTHKAWTSDNYRLKVTDNNGCVNWDDIFVTVVGPMANDPHFTGSGIPCDNLFNSTYRSAGTTTISTVTLTVNTTIDRDQYIDRKIVVPENITLTLKDCELRFHDDGGIIVQSGGNLKVTNVLFDPCGNRRFPWIVYPSGSTGGRLHVSGSVFLSSDTAIKLSNMDTVEIVESIFGGGRTGIYMKESQGYTIRQNRFYNLKKAVSTESSPESSGAALIADNFFSGVDTCLLFNSDEHSMLDIQCNIFQGYNHYAIYSNNSTLKSQGNGSTGPGNAFASSSSKVNHRLRHNGPAMMYYCDPNATFTLQQGGGYTAMTGTATSAASCPHLSLNREIPEIAANGAGGQTRIEILAYPNPFSDEVTFRYALPAGAKAASLRVFEAASGKVVYSGELDVRRATATLSGIDWAQSVYVCSVVTDNGYSGFVKLVNIK